MKLGKHQRSKLTQISRFMLGGPPSRTIFYFACSLDPLKMPFLFSINKFQCSLKLFVKVIFDQKDIPFYFIPFFLRFILKLSVVPLK